MSGHVYSCLKEQLKGTFMSFTNSFLLILFVCFEEESFSFSFYSGSECRLDTSLARGEECQNHNQINIFMVLVLGAFGLGLDSDLTLFWSLSFLSLNPLQVLVLTQTQYTHISLGLNLNELVLNMTLSCSFKRLDTQQTSRI